MDVCADGEPECSKRNGDGNVQGGQRRRILQSKALVRNVSRISGGAYYPRRRAPRLHVSGRNREHDPNEGVPDTQKNGRTDPRLTR